MKSDKAKVSISKYFDKDIAETRDSEEAEGQEEVKEMVDAALAKRGE